MTKPSKTPSKTTCKDVFLKLGPRAKVRHLFIETDFTRRFDRMLKAGQVPSKRDIEALNDYARALKVIADLA